VYPSELEDIIRTLPGVKDTAVAGKAAGIEIGYLPTAFVVKAENSDITEKDVHDWVEKGKDPPLEQKRFIYIEITLLCVLMFVVWLAPYIPSINIPKKQRNAYKSL